MAQPKTLITLAQWLAGEFEVSVGRFLSYDWGINPETGQAMQGCFDGTV